MSLALALPSVSLTPSLAADEGKVTYVPRSSRLRPKLYKKNRWVVLPSGTTRHQLRTSGPPGHRFLGPKTEAPQRIRPEEAAHTSPKTSKLHAQIPQKRLSWCIFSGL